MAGAPIDFYFDFSSPYGYLASEVIDTVAAKHGRAVAWRPFLLGAVFKISGGQPLPDMPLKGDYAVRDFARSARRLGVPYKKPEPFPFAGIAASRAFYWLVDDDPEGAKRLAHALLRRAFADGVAPATPDVVAEVATAEGFTGAAEALNDPAVKDRLRVEVEAAIERGVFGSPFFIVDGEPFWGHDRIPDVERWLKTGGW
jgi:2-hydroxychromene-2-carboxylate isomerase